jgi:SAM-dependent methyltransferase
MDVPHHPALRVPTPAGGPVSGPWSEVHFTAEGIPLLLNEVERYRDRVGDDEDAPLDALSYEALAHLSRYLPQLLAPQSPMRRAIRRALEDHLPGEVDLIVELGCSIGPDLRTFSEHARGVIGIDLSLAAIRAARAQLDGQSVPLLERIEGRSFRTAAPISLPPIDNVFVAVGNALDPPLFPEVADVVASVNVLDSVRDPLTLIGQMDAVLKPGGLLILASPFCWADDFTPPEAALGGGLDPRWVELGTAQALVALLSGHLENLPWLRYELLRTEDIPWSLRDHARSVTSYDVHVVVARKLRGLD